MRSMFLSVVAVSWLMLPACNEAPACLDGQVGCGDSCIDQPPADAEGLAASLLASSCAFSSCHGGSYPEEDLDLSSGDALRALTGRPSAQDPLRNLVEAGVPEASYLIDKLRDRNITPTDSLGNEASLMPPEQPLCEVKIEALEAWIAAGAQ